MYLKKKKKKKTQENRKSNLHLPPDSFIYLLEEIYGMRDKNEFLQSIHNLGKFGFHKKKNFSKIHCSTFVLCITSIENKKLYKISEKFRIVSGSLRCLSLKVCRGLSIFFW